MNGRIMKSIVWLLVLALVVLHQDVWNWDDQTLVLGFVPMSLFYHICISLAAGVVWFLACQFAWPQGSATSMDDSHGG